MGVNTRNMQSCIRKCNNLNKSHLVGQLLNFVPIISHLISYIRSGCGRRYSNSLWNEQSGDQIAVGGEIFRILPDPEMSWGPPSLLYPWMPGLFFGRKVAESWLRSPILEYGCISSGIIKLVGGRPVHGTATYKL